MKTLLLAAPLAALTLAGAAQAQVAAGPGAGAPGMRQPPNPDLDRDGKVTLAEFRQAQAQRITRMFARMDPNHDGKITRAEMQAARQRMAAGASGPGGPPVMAGRGDMFFTRNDANGDGAVTRAEMTKAMEQRFQAADTNHDGWLSKGELIMMRQRTRDGGQ